MSASSAKPPNPDEIRSAVARVFAKAAAPELSHKPAFAIGDFNGDSSEDLAVLVKPDESQLGEINNELANWVLEDPKNVTVPKINPRTPPKPARAEKDEMLLAIIHGVGPQGWRNPEAKQTYLLKNQGAADMASQSLANFQSSKERPKGVSLRGDVIVETIAGHSGLLYWTGAKYAWFQAVSK